MKRMIFVNIHVADLDRARAFYSGLGFSFNEQFSDHTAACLVISEEIHAMLLTTQKMQDFLPEGHGICDTTRSHEALLCLSCESREEVDKIVDKALATGGSSFKDPIDYGFMYYRSVQDPDGHIWEFAHMDMSQMPSDTADAPETAGTQA